MRLAGFAAFALAILVLIVAIGIAASLRYGITGRRVSAGLVVLLVMVGLNSRTVLAPQKASWQSQAISTLRAINMAQLRYWTSIGLGSYAASLDDLAAAGLLELNEGLRRHYELRLVRGGASYAVTAVAFVNTNARISGPIRSFCVDDRGTIYQTHGRTMPDIVNSRCGDTWTPIQ